MGEIVKDSWFSDIIGRSTYNLKLDNEYFSLLSDQQSEEYSEFARIKEDEVFIFTKVVPDEIGQINFLERSGFNLIDTNIILRKPHSKSPTFRNQCKIRLATAEDESVVLKITEDSYVYSRFHMDPNFSLEIANQIKVDWIKNYFLGKRGDKMIVATVDEKIAGYITMIDVGNGVLLLDLMAVDANYRRMGIASDLLTYPQTLYTNIDTLTGGTQVANLPVINAYLRLGYIMSEASYVFHYYN